jgi:two-component system, NtrC family, sensor kinase
MKKKIAFIFTVFLFHAGYAQYEKIDSLKKVLHNAKDSSRAKVLNELTGLYLSIPDSVTNEALTLARYYSSEALAVSTHIHYEEGIGNALLNAALIIDKTPNLNKQKALRAFQTALPFLKKSGHQPSIAFCMQEIAESSHIVGELGQAILYFDSVMRIVQGLGDTAWSVYPLTMKGHCYYDMGDYRQAYQIGIEALQLAERTKIAELKGHALVQLANLYLGAALPEIALGYVHKVLEIQPDQLKHDQKDWPWYVWWGLTRAGEAYLQLKQTDSAVSIFRLLPKSGTDGDDEFFIGHLYTALRQYNKALSSFNRGYNLENQIGHEIGAARLANELGRTYLVLKNFDSAIYYAKNALFRAQKIHALLEMRNAVGTLNDIYAQTKNYAEVYRYSQWYKSLNDSLVPEEYKQKLALVEVRNELDNQKQQALILNKDNEIKKQQLNREALIKKIFIAGILLLLFIAGITIRNNKLKQKANVLLNQQKEEIQSTLTELKSVQAQLIQSAKMASLGELTAGIAHEIQNPLNFVNNFSDLNSELIEELKNELQTGDKGKALEIADDISGNEQKINQHGKRADAIVKGMLMHSRGNIGTKELTDLNNLTVEYLRLSYHGFCDKDKFFKATIHTSFDEKIGKINIIPQDIGRVLINLYNNAFYALKEKKKLDDVSYEPAISVSTKKMGDKVEIHVKDNGGGIPDKLVDKIFQPFFTTKPTGQGTGLGLSLSYDIVTAHSGKLEVETKEGEGTELIVRLPLNATGI